MAAGHDAGQTLWVLVAQREITVRVRSKMFLISSAIMVVLVIGAVVAVHFLSAGTSTSSVAVASASGEALVTAAARTTDGSLSAKRYATPDQVRAAVTDGSADLALVPDAAGGGWTVLSQSTPDAAVAASLQRAVAAAALTANAQRLGVSVAAITAGAGLTVAVLGASADDAGFAWALTFTFGILFFMSCQLFGSTIGSSVAEEKESRVVEVLLAAIPVRALLIGKIIGNALLGIVQMAVLVAAVVVTAAVVGGIPHFGSLVRASGWFLLYYLIGFLTVSCLFAGLGALASRTQDLQAATMPVQLIVIAAYMSAVIGRGAVVTVGSYIPVISTVTMPGRIFSGQATWWQVTLSLAAALLFAVLAVQVSVRAYTYSILRTGARTSLLSSLSAKRRERLGTGTGGDDASVSPASTTQAVASSSTSSTWR